MTSDSVNIGAGALELYSPQCKIFHLSPSIMTPERQSPSLWVCEYCRPHLTVPLHGLSVLSSEPHNLKLESLSTVTGSQYHRRPWPVGLLSPSLIILSSVSLSIVARISQSDRVSHPGTVARCSQTYNLSLPVPFPCQRLTFPCDESLGAVDRGSLTQAWAGCHAAHLLCRSHLPRSRYALPSCHPVVRRAWGDSRSPRDRLQHEDKVLCHIKNGDLMGYYTMLNNQFVSTFQNNLSLSSSGWLREVQVVSAAKSSLTLALVYWINRVEISLLSHNILKHCRLYKELKQLKNSIQNSLYM